MNITIIDSFTLNPGDLNWDGLKELGECTIYDRTSPDQTIERATDADIVLTNKVVFDQTVIEQLPKLKYIGVLATGYNVVDLDAANARKITVTNVPAYSTDSVAQKVFALLFELTDHVADHSASAKSGKWAASPDFCYWDHDLIEIAGMTMGIVGFGGIGQKVAQIAKAFGMNVMVHTRTPKPKEFPDINYVEKETLFKESDIVTLHCPLTTETEQMVNTDVLSTMKPNAFIINTGRGPLLDEQAVADALNNNRIAGFSADVLSTEPPSPDNPLLSAKNCFITPHIAWATKASRIRLMNTAIENVRAFIDGKPQNVVNNR